MTGPYRLACRQVVDPDRPGSRRRRPREQRFKAGGAPADHRPVADPTNVLAAAVGARCPACAAALRPGAPWCTLCYTDLRPAPEPEPGAVPRAVPTATTAPRAATTAPAAFDPLTAPASTLGLPDRRAATTAPATTTAPDATTARATTTAPAATAATAVTTATWPCGTCGADNALSDDACEGCGAGFLAGLRDAEGPLLALPGVGDLGALSRAQRLGLAAGVVLVLSLLVLLLGVLSP